MVLGDRGRATKLDVDQLVAAVRSDAGPEMVASRAEFEANAREILNEAAGRMTREQAHELGRALNSGAWGGSVKHNRFMPGFSAPLIERMTEDLDAFNALTVRLWRGTEAEALAVLDDIVRDRSMLPGAGRSFPSALMYLRDNGRYAIWFDSLDKGLSHLTDYQGADRAGGAEAYLGFCRAAFGLAARRGLHPQEIDAVLAEAARRRTQIDVAVAADAETPTIPFAAFEFLSELRDNNNKEWFDRNRMRYERDLRDPLAEVFQAIADDWVIGLDPEINATVKRDEVLARINKWSSGDAYYTYLWGSFSRAKKQEDVQLFINVDSQRLRYGLSLASAPEELRERLATRFRDGGEEFYLAIMSRLDDHGLRWEPEEDQETATPASAEDLAMWAEGKSPHLVRVLEPTHELIGSPELLGAIGRSFEAMYPLAALAWGDDPSIVLPDPPDGGGGRPEYTLADLARDTHLPIETLEEWIELLRGPKKAALLYGPPGTGKSFVAERLGRFLAGTDGENSTVQFHPSFSYEDFIEGLRPESHDGSVSYRVRDGVFAAFCEAARGKDAPHVFVVDEINRAELGSVLGEVMMLIEYRDRRVPLPYSQRPFSIPRNIVLLATMNTADRSLALVDFALRRRFHALRMPPSREVVAAFHERAGRDGRLALGVFDVVQRFVADENYAPGHSYWMVSDVSAGSLERVWKYELRPYLEEFWFESRGRLVELEREVLTLLAEGA